MQGNSGKLKLSLILSTSSYSSSFFLRQLVTARKNNVSMQQSFFSNKKRYLYQATAMNKDSYQLLKTKDIAELGLVAQKYKHLSSGATVIHLHKEGEKNCAFATAFRTFPTDSTGVAHVLEHTVLCGSEQYPVRDPFFKMLNRSLSTYMNAWTSSDWTMYPFTTQNREDYKNLRNVYMDAVFKPKLDELDFRQEGWRLEKSEKDDSVNFNVKGVVYNEMKGVFSDNESVYSARLQQAMLPGSIYGHVSGGDPIEITKLSHQQLLTFHQKHYNPTNALIISYGDMDLGEHLNYLDQTLLKDTGSTESIKDAMRSFTPWTSPKRVQITCLPDPLGEAEKQIKHSISFLCNPIADRQTTLYLQILSTLLLDGPSSPMYQALIESNIGTDYAPGTGYDSSTAIATFTIGLQGMAKDDINKVETIIFKTLEQVKRKGFAQQRIDAILHQVELGLKYHSSNFGLGLLQKIAGGWVHNICPLEDLGISEKLEHFREAHVKDEHFFGKLIDQYLLNNNHCLHFTMSPDSSHKDLILSTERAMIDDLAKEFTIDDQNKNTKLDQLQDTDKEKGKELLPCLAIEDVDLQVKPNPYVICEQDKTILYTRIVKEKANGIVYFKALVPLPDLDDDQTRLLPLLVSCFTELGVSGRSMEEFDQAIKMYTGGLRLSILNHTPKQEGKQLSLMLSSYALNKNVDKMFDLFIEALTTTNWSDHDRLRTTISGAANSMMNSIASSGHQFANSFAAAGLNAYRRRNELMSGLSQVNFINGLSSQIQAKEGETFLINLSEQLKKLASILLSNCPSKQSNSYNRAVLVSDTLETLEESKLLVKKLVQDISTCYSSKSSINSSTKTPSMMPTSIKRHAITSPFSTNFVGISLFVNNLNINEYADLAILSRLMTPKYLHGEIREKGGAYGGGCSYSQLDNLFSFYSYRDPNPIRTIEIFNNVPKWLATVNFTEQDLLEAKLSTFSDLDTPQDLASEGLAHFKYDLTDLNRQQYRDALFAVDVESVKSTAFKFFDTKQYSSVLLVEDTKEIVNKLSFMDFKLVDGVEKINTIIE